MDALSTLRARISAELREDVRPSAHLLASRIQAEHPRGAPGAVSPVLGILFYGSCLRKESDEGLLDFWVIVEDYADAYAGRGLRGHALAFANRIAAPNVFYLEHESEEGTLRTKYGVIRLRDFEAGTSMRAWHPYIWARFAQPARLLRARDAQAREAIEHAVTEAGITMVGRLICFLPIRAGRVRFRLPAFWREAFQRTYDSERRPEADESIQALYHADEERYDAVAELAVKILADRGEVESVEAHPRAVDVQLSSRKRARSRFRWRIMRPYARGKALVRLLKTSWTFGDWVPYALWKIERHTGRTIELSDRQRRHPLIFGWPVILRLLTQRNLR